MAAVSTYRRTRGKAGERQKEVTASDLARQEVGEPRTCLPEDYERGDAAE